LAAAQDRFRFSGLSDKELRLHPEGLPLPCPTDFFDAVFCESALAVMHDDVLEKPLAEISRVLRPGGAFVFNESVWRDGTPPETILEINRECQKRFGIPQASERFPYAQDWINLCVAKGFQTPEMLCLKHIPEVLPALPTVRRRSVLFKSKLFNLVGILKSRFFPKLRKQRREWLENEEFFKRYGLFLEGVLFKTRKPNQNRN